MHERVLLLLEKVGQFTQTVWWRTKSLSTLLSLLIKKRHISSKGSGTNIYFVIQQTVIWLVVFFRNTTGHPFLCQRILGDVNFLRDRFLTIQCIYNYVELVDCSKSFSPMTRRNRFKVNLFSF